MYSIFVCPIKPCCSGPCDFFICDKQLSVFGQIMTELDFCDLWNIYKTQQFHSAIAVGHLTPSHFAIHLHQTKTTWISHCSFALSLVSFIFFFYCSVIRKCVHPFICRWNIHMLLIVCISWQLQLVTQYG